MWERPDSLTVHVTARLSCFNTSYSSVPTLQCFHLPNMGHTKEEQCSYLSVCISSCKHNRVKIESSNQAFVLDQVCKWRSVGGAWYSQMCSQTGCLLLPLAWECFYTRAHIDVILWYHHAVLLSHFLNAMSQPQAGSHTRAATYVAKLTVGTWLPTGLLWVNLEQVPILIHARPSFKGEIHELDRGMCTLYFYRQAHLNCSSQMFILKKSSLGIRYLWLDNIPSVKEQGYENQWRRSSFSTSLHAQHHSTSHPTFMWNKLHNYM